MVSDVTQSTCNVCTLHTQHIMASGVTLLVPCVTLSSCIER